MEIPEDQRKTDAYKCFMSINTTSTKSDMNDVLRHYSDKGFIIDTLSQREMHITLFSDGSALMFIGEGKSKYAMSIITKELIMRAMMSYFPYERIARCVAQPNPDIQ